MRVSEQVTNSRRWVWMLLISIILVRFFSLGLYPLSDRTEANYGNIARLMVETGNWITPQFSLNVPYWGKPPLSTWLSAIAMKLFGINEFAARIPSFLLAMIILVLVRSLATRQQGGDAGLVSMVVLISCPFFFICSGAIMTDPSLLLATTLCMVAFWQAITSAGRAGRLWGYAFFIGLAIGLLAKGPVVVVLTALPIVAWVIWQRQWTKVWRRLPWISGLILTLILSAPWYLLAERKTPGFLYYFLVGEHWKRFTVPGWKGDLYGSAHLRPIGTIWLYGLACALPWSLILPVQRLVASFRHQAPYRRHEEEGWVPYLVVWMLAPMVFFTLAGNILWTYVLPGLPAFAMLTAEQLQHGSQLMSEKPVFALPVLRWTASCMLLLYALALIMVTLGYGPAAMSQKSLIATYQHNGIKGKSLTYFFNRPASAEFYTRGLARLESEPKEAEKLFRNKVVDYFAIEKSDLERLPPSFLAGVTNLCLINRHYLLMENLSVLLSAGLSAPADVTIKCNK